MKKRNWLYYLYCALGEKSKEDDREADRVALIRLFIFLSVFITNGFIILNTIRSYIISSNPNPIKCIIINK